MLTCCRCGYQTDVKGNLVLHLKRKNICQGILSEKSQAELLEEIIMEKILNDKTYDCEYCGKKFNHSSAKCRHKKTCKHKDSNDLIESQIEKIRDELRDELRKEIKAEILNCTVTNNNCTINNIQNNIQQNNTITLENFGKENVEFLADSFIRRCLFRAPDGVTDLTKKIHFNPNKPEYHNVTTTNKKDGFLEVFKDGKWIYDDKNKVLDALIKQSFDILSSHYDQFDDEIKTELSPTNFKRVDRFVESVLNQDKTIQNSLRKCLYLLILNNRHMVDKNN
jgi:hypothetical protein